MDQLMAPLDLRTLLIVYSTISALCLTVMASLWLQNHRHTPEIKFWLADYAMQFAAILLVSMSGRIPVLLSTVMPGFLIISGTIILYIGLERYTGRKSGHVHFYIMLIIFITIQVYLTYTRATLSYRLTNSSAAFLYACAHCTRLMLFHTRGEQKNATRFTGIVLAGFCLIAMIHLLDNISIFETQNLLSQYVMDTLLLMAYLILYILLTFALFLMTGRRLLSELEAELAAKINMAEEVKKNRQRLLDIVETLNDMVWEVDPVGRYTYLSPQVKHILGYEPEELIGKTPAYLMTPEEAGRITEIFGQSMQQKKPIIALENINVHKDGHEVVLETNGMPFFDAKGNPMGYRGTDRDITERKMVEDKLFLSEEKFSKAFLTSPYVMTLSRVSDGKFFEANNAFFNLLDFSREEVIGKSSVDLKIWATEKDRLEVTSDLLNGKSITGREYLFRKKNGEILNGVFSAHLIQMGGETCILSSVNDITDRKHAEEKLKRQQRFLSDLIENSGTLISVKSREGHYILVNRRWEISTGFKREDIIGRNVEEIFPGEIGKYYRMHDLEVLKSGSVMEMEEKLESPNGPRFFLVIKFPLKDDNGMIYGICGMMTDITERKENEEKIRHLATHDVLTDLPTMRLARDRLSMAMGMSMRHNNKTAVMFIDLDGFKAVNDTMGHDTGDHVLKEVAERILSCIRKTDTAARVGGDEFLVISTEIHITDDAAQIAENIIHLVSRPVMMDDRKICIGTSIGISLYPDHGNDMEQLIKRADEAMYRVKKSGKSGYCISGNDTVKTT